MFGGAKVFADEEWAALFAQAVDQIQRTAETE
jgi:hypothetical protein